MKTVFKIIALINLMLTSSIYASVNAPSNLIILNSSPSLLASPSSLTASYVATNKVSLNWSSNSGGTEGGFYIYATLNTNSGWKVIATSKINGTNLVVQMPQAPSYYYKVLAHVYSPFSSTVTNIPQNKLVTLSWQNTSANASEICIDRNSFTPWTQIAVIPANSGIYKDTNVVNGVQYFYEIRSHEYSAYSNVAFVPPCTISGSNMTVHAILTNCATVVNYPIPVSSGSCGPVVCNPPPGSSFSVGTNIVTCTTSNGTYGSFNIVVLDTVQPYIECPGTIVKQAPAGVAGLLIGFGSSANCGDATFSFNPPSGTVFPVGTNIITYTITDSSGNSSSCNFNLIVLPAPDPAMNAPSLFSVTNLSPCLVNNFLSVLPTNLPITCMYSDGTNFYGQINISTLSSNVCFGSGWDFETYQSSCLNIISNNICYCIGGGQITNTAMICFTLKTSNPQIPISLSFFPAP